MNVKRTMAVLMVLLGALLSILLLIAQFGCCGKTQRQTKYIDDFFHDYSMALDHGIIRVIPEIKPRFNKPKAVTVIIAYLEARPDALSSREDYMFFESVRARDFWAVVLSRLVEVELILLVTEPEPQRDEKIARFVKDLHQKGIR